MMKHLKETHNYSVKALNKIRPKLMAKANEVNISQRMKTAKKSVERTRTTVTKTVPAASLNRNKPPVVNQQKLGSSTVSGTVIDR